MTAHDLKKYLPSRRGRWSGSLFIKCLVGIMCIFFFGTVAVFSFGGMKHRARLDLEMEPDNVIRTMRQGLAGISPAELKARAESPFCHELLQAMVSDLIDARKDLWRRYNRSLAFHEDYFLIVRYRDKDTVCEYVTKRPGDLPPLIDEMEAQARQTGAAAGMRTEISASNSWITVASLPVEGAPETFVTLGVQVKMHPLGVIFPELRAAGHVLIHLTFISFLSALLLAAYVVRRIRRAERVAAEWALGNLGVRINDPGRDEFGRLSAAFDHMADVLGKNIEVKQSLAASEERNRLARDLHDTAKQRCFVLGLRLSLLARICQDDPKRTELVQSALELTKLVQSDLADVIQRFSWPTIAQAGLLKATTDSLDILFQGSDINWSIDLKPEEAAELESEPFWAGQLLLITTEAAANVLKHSRASNMKVSFHSEGETGFWIIEDDGCGFDESRVSGRGMGLSNMKQRAESCPGGHLVIKGGPGCGTVLKVIFDYSESTKSEDRDANDNNIGG
ncbi:hypothetical protein C4J81_17690 [Deltaproteobacteria bacterium Smac51]|nr:hypothetical protein C4J81_17690 [Deltaproteobacteria bacterium Smac51]